eukprot:TRINITY_DN65350_c0_g1_i1.p2 TRINITY_DN65350_c0_g1~~TRINITY_DN65350_c0_g1_i1.p2  ORF type:complete len:397 (+),score=133.06 TRINITY_DN65350_c0_g1_i1:99-1193(+)
MSRKVRRCTALLIFGVTCVCTVFVASTLPLTAAADTSGSVVLIQDAGIDDYMCTVLLARCPATAGRFRGEVIVNADSALPYSVQAASMLHAALGVQGKLGFGLSSTRMFNAFPWLYRRDTVRFHNLSSLQQYPSAAGSWPYADGDRWLRGFLELQENGSVDVAITTAPTPLTEVLKQHPQLAAKIRKVLWMAGAVYQAGNLDPTQFPWKNSKAEWNAYTDPFAARELLLQSAQHGFPVYLFPLDVSDTTPIHGEYMQELRNALAASPPNSTERAIRQLVLDAYTIVENDKYYRLWDVITVGYLQWPELYAAPQLLPLDVETDPAKEQGWTRVCSPTEGCPTVRVLVNFTSEAARRQFIRNVALA